MAWEWLTAPVITAVTGVAAWAVRVESRLSTQEKIAAGLKESIHETIESIDKRLGTIEGAIIQRGLSRDRDKS